MTNLLAEIQELERAIGVLEAQRPLLGSAVVDAALTAMREKLSALTKASQRPASLEGERRFVTVLFADLSGFTALSEKLDPEAVRDLMNACFDCLVPVIQKYGGMVDKFIGDEIMALFGAPQAREDDPERALRSALEMMESLRDFNMRRNTQLEMHIGINSGMVIAGGLGSQDRLEYSVMGDAVNVAARLEDASPSGSIFVGPDTQRLTAAFFEFEPLPPLALKGKEKPLQAYKLLAARSLPGRARGLEGMEAHLSGRDAELQRGLAVLEAAAAGRGRALFLVAEAGLGKSRLAREMRQASERHWPGLRWLESATFSYETTQPYGLVQRLFRRLCGLGYTEPSERVLQSITPHLAALPAEAQNDFYRLLGELFALDALHAQEDAARQGQAFRGQLFHQMHSFWQAQAAAAPTILLLEDLHWCDPASADLFIHLMGLCASAPLVFVCTMRPDPSTPGWKVLQHAQQLGVAEQVNLSPLNAGETTALVADLLQDAALPAPLLAFIHHKAEGNPFFIEEIVRSLLEHGALQRGPSGWEAQAVEEIDVPDTLQSLLHDRIDRLEPQPRRALQAASVIGRAFYFRVLQKITEGGPALEGHVDRLEQAGLIQEANRRPELEYMFRHVLVQEAAYGTILRQQRREFHQRVAETLEALFPDQLEENAPTLAYHFGAAGDDTAALRYAALAGEVALRLHAIPEALAHFDRALELARALDAAATPPDSGLVQRLYLQRGRALEHLPDFAAARQMYLDLIELAGQRASKETQAMRLAALIALAVLLSIPSPIQDREQAGAAIAQGRALATAQNDQRALARLTWAEMLSIMYSGHMQEAIPSGKQVVEMARQLADDYLLSHALQDISICFIAARQLTEGMNCLKEAHQLWVNRHDLAMLAENLANQILLYTLMGNLRQAHEMYQRSLEISTQIGNPWGQATANVLGQIALIQLGELGQSLTYSHAAMRSSILDGHPGRVGTRIMLALAYQYCGSQEEMRNLVEAAEQLSRGFIPFRPPALAMLARVRLAEGNLPAARAHLDELSGLGIGAVIGTMDLLVPLVEIEYALAAREGSRALEQAAALIQTLEQENTLCWLADVYQLQAYALQMLGNPAAASQSLERAITLARHMNARRPLWECLAHLASITTDPARAAALRAEAAEIAAWISSRLNEAAQQNSLRQRALVWNIHLQT